MRPHVAGVRTGGLLVAVALLMMVVGAFLAPDAVLAEDPFRLASQIEDRAGALGDQKDEVQAALASLQNDESVQLWVAYVDTFSGVGAQQWVEETAIESDLGLRDVLLAVAVEDRAYAYSVDQNFPLTEDELNEVMTVAVEPALSQNDWAGAAVGAATGMSQALHGAVVTTVSIQPGPSGTTGGFPVGTVVAIIIIVVVVALIIWMLIRRSRSRRGAVTAAGGAVPQPQVAPTVPLAELRRQASLQLVETDDAIKTSTEELGFAIAEFGEEQAAPFKQALAEAKSELDQAFALHRQFDEKADEGVQRRVLTALLEHTAAANQKLDAQVERFDRLRDLENKAPGVLDATERQLTELEARLPKARQELAGLASLYSAAALKSVAANADEAASRISFAREQIAAGREDAAGGRRGEAAVGALAAQEAAGQARSFLDAIGRLAADLSDAQGRIDAAVAETRRDIAEARGAAGAPQLGALVATAEAAVTGAVSAAAPEGGRDPLAALRHLEEADAALENALVQVREQQVQQAKAAEVLERTLLGARAEISAADDYITTHRGAISSGPRATLAEAQQLYNEAVALGPSDPMTAGKKAASAHELAARALGDAKEEAEQSTGMGGLPGMGGGMGGMMGQALGGAGSSLAGAILGGILAGGLMGGGPHGGGGSVFGGGGFGPASFGGMGTRMRRGGGGRF